MRSISRRARWVTYALALAIAIPSTLATTASAEDKTPTVTKKKRRSVAECTSFDQRDRDEEDGVDFAVHNACAIPVSCSVSWALTCAPESRKRKSRRHDNKRFQLDAAHGISVTATTTHCGDDSWSIDRISWSCEPAKD